MGGMTIARIQNDSEISYLHADHLGSPAAATNENGNLLWEERFTPFGEQLLDPNANRHNEGFTGHISDSDTGLTYMQARHYDPVIGRFLSGDPVGFAEGGPAYFNRYAYTANDPVNAIDPDCECPNCVTGGIGFWQCPESFAHLVMLRRLRLVEVSCRVEVACPSRGIRLH
jgi:RHS repeat-associated protein